jgi:hypothetical protein
MRLPKLLFVLAISVVVLGAFGCRDKAQSGAQPTAQASPQAAAAASPTVVASPGAANPNQAIAVPGQVPKSLEAIPERLRRPLTLEEIKQLPPETRDMILKAIGQPVPSPSPSPKKK